jgi:hypothetical protein
MDRKYPAASAAFTFPDIHEDGSIAKGFNLKSILVWGVAVRRVWS